MKLAEKRSETVFQDFKPALSAGHAFAEASRCLFCEDAPCTIACPTSIDIPQFIRKIATGNLKGSARTIFDANILGSSCARVCPVEVLCVGACVYNHMDQPPIQIGKLQRHATDHAIAQGWQFHAAGPDSGFSVGLVGGGPASLSAAHQLRRQGHAVTIYEKRSVIGGLDVTGVAPYKVRADDVAKEIDWLLGIGGIEVRTGVQVGADVTWAELEQRHDALFVGIGLGADSLLDVPGAQLPGVQGAVAFIEAMKLGTVDLSNVRHALVIGGGNTAVDAVRELNGLGVKDVTLVYRGTEAGMPGYKHEWKVAKIDGVHAAWQALPVAFQGNGRVESVRCIRMDEHKKPIPGAEFDLPADLVLLGIGQAKLGELLGGLPGVTLDKGRVVVDANGFTGRRGLWAGGDCTNGGKEVVNAVAEGKSAAIAIDEYLTTTAAAARQAKEAPHG